ncbi:MAG: NUDIX domain-containing protein [Candidatus Woesearchaeota archaeon]
MEEYDGAIGIVFRRKEDIEFLIIHNRLSGNNTFPAGGRENDEVTSLETINREIKEETGYEKIDYIITPTSIIHTFIYGKNKKERAGQTARQPVYIVEIISEKDPSPNDSDSTIEGWYSYNLAREKLTFDDSKKILDKIINLIK